MVNRSVRDELERRCWRGLARTKSADAESSSRRLATRGGAMLGYLEARIETVTSLVDEVATAASGGDADFTVLDLAGRKRVSQPGVPKARPRPPSGGKWASTTPRWQMYAKPSRRPDTPPTPAGSISISTLTRPSSPTPPDSVSCSVRCRRTAGRQRTLPRRSPSPANMGWGASTSTITASAGWTLWIGFVRPSQPERGSDVAGLKPAPTAVSWVGPQDLSGC